MYIHTYMHTYIYIRILQKAGRMAFFTVETYADRYALRVLYLLLLLSICVCSCKAGIRRLDAIIRLAAAARSWAISERCIKYLALLASKVLILAAAATCLHRPLALAAGPVTSTFQFTCNPFCFPCLYNRSVSHIMSRCAKCAIGGLSPQVDNGFASINKQNPVEVFPPIWPNWPIDTSFLRLIPHMQHAADPSPTCCACQHLACGTV